MTNNNMLKIFFCFFLLINYKSYCQPIDMPDTSNNIGITFNSFFEYTDLKSKPVKLLNLRIGLLSSTEYEIGITYHKLISNLAPDNFPSFDLKFHIYGADFFFSKYFIQNKVCHPFITISLGTEYFKIENDISNQFILFNSYNNVFESDSYLLIKLATGIDYNLSKYFQIDFHAGYRIAIGITKEEMNKSKIINMDNNQFSNYFINLGIKYIFYLNNK
jgi:hypothetical protein